MLVFRQPNAMQQLLALMMVTFLGLSTPVQSETLSALFKEAKKYDAAYLAVKEQSLAAVYQTKQADALLRPMINLKGNLARQHFDTSSINTSELSASQMQALQLQGAGQNVGTTVQSIAIEGKQSIYNSANNDTVAQAEQAIIVAHADLKAAERDLMVRLAQAYFDVLAAKDLLQTTQANKKAVAEQLASAKRNFELGNATITDTREAQARHDLANAQEIAALNELHVKKLALDQMVGRENITPQTLTAPLILPPLEPANVEHWVDFVPNSSPVRKASAGLKIAQLETSKARAGHKPTIDLLASLKHTKLDSSSLSTEAASNGTTSLLGIEMNIPLFAGFSTQNKIKEKLALEEKSERDLENAERSVKLATRQAFFGVQSGMAQIKALEAAESSAQLALEATQLGYRVGVRVNKDVLDAQTALSNTQKDLYKARYEVLIASMKLREVSGVLQAKDLAALDRLLVH